MGLFDCFARWILPRVAVENKQIAALRAQLESFGGEEVVYVVRRPSYLEAALVQQILLQHTLPVPNAVVRPFRDAEPTSSAKVSLIALRWRTGYELSLARVRRYRSWLTNWLDKKQQAPVTYVPLSIAAGLGPRPWPGRSYWPIDFSYLPLGDLWLVWVYWFQRNSLSLDIGPALTMQSDLSGGEFQTKLSKEIYRKEKATRGAQTQPAQTVENIVLSGPQFEEVLLQLASTTSESRPQLYRRARGYLRKMAAQFRGSAIYLLYLIVHPVITTVFSAVRVHNLDSLRELTARTPVVLLPSHRSHFDYVLMSYILYKANLPLPYVAAGVNLNFWPFGSLARSAGAFFIWRSIDNDPLYKCVLDNYMSYVTKQGHTLEFFIEGGRSRSGAMRKPRLGLLKYLIRSWEQGGRDDISLVPIGITYERLAEEKALHSELKGGGKRKENLFELLRLTSIWKKRFGSVVTVVGEPFSLREFYHDLDQGRENSDRSLNLVTEDLGYAVSRRIMDCTALTGTALSSAALLSMPQYRCSTERAVGRMISLLQIIFVARGYSAASSWSATSCVPTEALASAELVFSVSLEQGICETSLADALLGVLGRIESFELAKSDDEGEARMIEVPEDRRLRVEYYKNNLMHLLVAPAGIAFSAREDGVVDVKELYDFHQHLKSAFLFPFWREWRLRIDEVLRHFESCNWVERTADFSLGDELPVGTCQLTPAGREALQPVLRLLLPYFESWYAGLQAVAQLSWESQLESEFIRDMQLILDDGGCFPAAPRTESAASTMTEFTLSALLEAGVIRSEISEIGRSDAKRLFAVNPAQQPQLEEQLARVRQILVDIPLMT